MKVAVGSSELRDLKGYPVGLGGANYFPSSQRIFLAGDAAGLVDALLGEGIHNAIRSGQAAAAGIISDLSGAGSALRVFRQQLAPIQAGVASCARSAAILRTPQLRLPGIGIAIDPLCTNERLCDGHAIERH